MTALPEPASAEVSVAVDPITLEVLRHRLWTASSLKARSNRRPLFPFCFDICTSCDQNPIAGRLHFRQQGPTVRGLGYVERAACGSTPSRLVAGSREPSEGATGLRLRASAEWFKPVAPCVRTIGCDRSGGETGSRAGHGRTPWSTHLPDAWKGSLRATMQPLYSDAHDLSSDPKVRRHRSDPDARRCAAPRRTSRAPASFPPHHPQSCGR